VIDFFYLLKNVLNYMTNIATNYW